MRVYILGNIRENIRVVAILYLYASEDSIHPRAHEIRNRHKISIQTQNYQGNLRSEIH